MHFSPARPLPRITACLLVAMALLACVPAAAGATSLKTRIARAVAHSGIAASTDVLAFDVDAQRLLYASQPDRMVAPASNEKLYTTVATLRGLGVSYRFSTRLAYKGIINGDTLNGHLYLIGGGDPVLGTSTYYKKHFDGVGSNLDTLASDLDELGVTHVTGRLVVDESFLDTKRYVDAWPTSYRYFECAALGALVVNQNATQANWSARTASKDPAAHAGAVFRELLKARGITVDGSTANRVTPDDAEVIGELKSPPLWKILRFMDRESDNFTAEMLVKDLGAVKRSKGTTADGRKAMRIQLKQFGLDIAPLRLYDGSGLAARDRTSARLLGDLLNRADTDAVIGPVFNGLLAVAGKNGTLRKRLRHRPYRGHVFGKTGTLSRSSALSGFAQRVHRGHRYGFSVVTYSGSGRVSLTAAHDLQDAIAKILVR